MFNDGGGRDACGKEKGKKWKGKESEMEGHGVSRVRRMSVSHAFDRRGLACAYCALLRVPACAQLTCAWCCLLVHVAPRDCVLGATGMPLHHEATPLGAIKHHLFFVFVHNLLTCNSFNLYHFNWKIKNSIA